MYSSNSNVDILYSETNKELIQLDDWFRANKLSLNVKKTNYSIFSPTKFTGNEQNPNSKQHNY